MSPRETLVHHRGSGLRAGLVVYPHQEQISEHTLPIECVFIYLQTICMCYPSTKIFFPCPRGVSCASPGAQHPTLESTAPEDVPRKFFSSLLPLLPPSTSANNPFSFFHLHFSHLCITKLQGTLCWDRCFWKCQWGEAAPHLHPILRLCHCPNSVLILLAPMNRKTRFVACCLHCWGVQAGAGCDCLAGTEVQADTGAGRAGVLPFKQPGCCLGFVAYCQVGLLLTNKDK